MQTKLATIADLDQPSEVKQPFISRAMELASFYEAWKAQDTGGYSYMVDIPGSEKRASGIHASELSCQRRMVYSLMDTERRVPDYDINMKMRFNIGHAAHAMLQHEFKLMCTWLTGNVSFQSEVGIHPELGGVSAKYTMYSSCDGKFEFWAPTGDPNAHICYLRVGVEIKTASEKEFDKLVKPKDDHREQTCMYMRALDLPLMWTVYYNKSNSNYTKSTPPYLFQFDHSLWTGRVEPRIVGAHTAAQMGQLPNREEGFYCRWCPFKWTCTPVSAQRNTWGPSSTVHQPGALKV